MIKTNLALNRILTASLKLLSARSYFNIALRTANTYFYERISKSTPTLVPTPIQYQEINNIGLIRNINVALH
jgi:hypothetical protein